LGSAYSADRHSGFERWHALMWETLFRRRTPEDPSDKKHYWTVGHIYHLTVK